MAAPNINTTMYYIHIVKNLFVLYSITNATVIEYINFFCYTRIIAFAIFVSIKN